MTYDIAFDEVWRFVEVVLEGMRRGRVEGGSGGPGSKDSDVLSSARHPIPMHGTPSTLNLFICHPIQV